MDFVLTKLTIIHLLKWMHGCVMKSKQLERMTDLAVDVWNVLLCFHARRSGASVCVLVSISVTVYTLNLHIVACSYLPRHSMCSIKTVI